MTITATEATKTEGWTEDKERRLVQLLRAEKRERAQTNLLEFTRYTFPAYQAEPFHKCIAAHLDAVVEGRIKKLMIFAPPQEGKSELVSVRLPSYWLMQHPDSPVLITSYASTRAEELSRDVRSTIISPGYSEISTTRLSRDSKAIDLWRLAPPSRGFLQAAGVQGPVTGLGFGLGIIDDPVKDWMDAYSETVRSSKWFWYNSVFQGRIWEGGAMVFINTPWHPDDLLMQVLRAEPERFTVLRIPALAETQDERDEANAIIGLKPGLADPLKRQPGEACCPGRHSREYYEDLRRKTIPAVWKALYMCSPRPSEGSIIRREWLRFYTEIPDWTWESLLLSVDCSFKDTKGADFVVGTVWGRKADRIYLLDLVRDRLDEPGTREMITNLRRKWPQSSQVLIEEAANGAAVIKALQVTIGGIVAVKPQGGKESRLRAVADMFYQGQVYLPQGADWLEGYITELTNFNGEGSIPHDDQVDSTSQALLRWVGMTATEESAEDKALYEQRAFERALAKMKKPAENHNTAGW